MRWTNEQLREYQARRSAAGIKLPPAKPQQDPAPALVETKTGEAEDTPRIGVRIGIHRSRITDLDNAWGGSKALTDCLVLVGLLPNDSPSDIDLNVQQIKVGKKEEERTVIEITYP